MASAIQPTAQKQSGCQYDNGSTEQLAALNRARRLPVYPEPQVPRRRCRPCRRQPNFDKALAQALVRQINVDKIHGYFQGGGEIDHRDHQRNTPVHLLAIHHCRDSDNQDTLTILSNAAGEMMSYYTPLEATEICRERNLNGNTVWHELINRGSTGTPPGRLLPATVVIIRRLLQAAASPLYSGRVEHLGQCPALVLLPYLGREPELVSLIINTDPNLVIHYQYHSNRTLARLYPTLPIAAIRLGYPALLTMLLEFGASWSCGDYHPAHTVLEQIRHWPKDKTLRQCGMALCRNATTVPGGQLPCNLLAALTSWEQQLRGASVDLHRAIKESVVLLLNLVEQHDIPMICQQPGTAPVKISQGLQLCLQRQFTRLWRLYNPHEAWESGESTESESDQDSG